MSFEASWVLAGVPPIGIVLGERARLYKIIHNMDRGGYECEQPQPAKEWPHPASRPNCSEPGEPTQYSTIIFTDGTKTDDKVGAGVAIYMDQELRKRCKYKLGGRCTNKQAEQLAILKSLDELPEIHDQKNKTAAMYTDSQVTLDSLKNTSIHTPIISGYKEKITTNKAKLEDPLRMGKIAHRNRRERNGRQTGKRGGGGHLQFENRVRQDNKEHNRHRAEEGRDSKMARTMGKDKQRSAMQVVPPICRAETKNQSTHLARVHSHSIRTRENEIISSQIRNNRQRNVPVQRRRPRQQNT